MCPTGCELSRTVDKSNLRSAFNVIDGDGDGRISHNDGISGSNDDVIGSMISAADSDRNGYVEYEELESILNVGEDEGEERKKKKEEKGSVMEAGFRVMDKDGDGKVKVKELSRMGRADD